MAPRKTVLKTSTSITGFHSIRSDRNKRVLEKALEENRITGEDATLVKAFVSELESVHNIGTLRAIKIVSTLVGIRRFIGPFADLTITDVYAGITELKTANNMHGKPFKKNSIYDFVRVLKPFCLWMIENNHSSLPEKKVLKLQVPSRDPMTKVASDLLTVDEINTMIKASCRTVDRALIMTLYEGGFRIGEIGMLKWSDLVFDVRGVVANVRFKTEKPRYIRLVMAKDYLAQWKADYPFDPDKPGALVFLNERNNPLTHRGVYVQLQRIADRGGLNKHVTPHTFRHSRITHLIREGLSESIIKKMMWGNINTDQFITYAHLTGQDVDDAMMSYYGLEDDSKQTKKLRKMEPVQCPACKHINTPRSDFCSGCGNRFTDKAVTDMAVIQNSVISNNSDFKAYIDRLVDEKVAKMEVRRTVA